MSDPKHVDDRDLELIFAYARGEMAEADSFAFEARLSGEPELAAAYEAFASVDSVVESIHHRDSSAQPEPANSSTSPWWTPVRLAAAAVLVAVAWWALAGDRELQLEVFEMAAMATPFEEDTDVLVAYGRGLGIVEPERLPPSNLGTRSGQGGVPPEPRSPAEYLGLVGEAERERENEALVRGATAAPIKARYATLRFRAPVEVSAVVISVDSESRVRRLYPNPSGDVFSEAVNRFGPGEVHVLPRPVVVRDPSADDAVHHHLGFALPFDADKVRLVLGLRLRQVDAELLAELDAWLARDEARDDPQEALTQVETWLRDHEFVSQTRRLDKPED